MARIGRTEQLSAPRRTRRALLGALAGCAAFGHAVARADAVPPRRVVTMNWELTETVLALGVVPVGTSLPDWYRRTVVDPPLPQGVADIGLLYQPNFDVLQALHPDLMVITPGHASARPWLERLAPTMTLGRYMTDPEPYRALCAETAQLAARLGCPARAAALTEAAARTAGDVRARLAARGACTALQVIVAERVDDRYLRVYGRGSLFDALLEQIGIENAVHRRDGFSWPTRAGFALVPLQRLAEVPRASLLLVGPAAPGTRGALERNAIWAALPAVREGRVATLPVIAPYGGLISMQRFALAVEAALNSLAAGGAHGA